jgi:hypothetical protein
MCTVLLPPGDNPVAVNKYISYHYRVHNRLPDLSIGSKWQNICTVFGRFPSLSFGPTQCILNGDASFLGCNAVLTGKRLPVSTAWRPKRCKSFNDTAAGTWNTRTVPWMSFSCCPHFLQAHGTNITFDSVHRLFRPLGTNYRSTQGCRGRRTDSVFSRT